MEIRIISIKNKLTRYILISIIGFMAMLGQTHAFNFPTLWKSKPQEQPYFLKRAYNAVLKKLPFKKQEKLPRHKQFLKKIGEVKQSIMESEITPIAKDIIIGLTIQIALFYAWNNEFTQEGVKHLKKILITFCREYGITNIGFIDSLINFIDATYAKDMITPASKSCFYSTIVSHLLDVATNPIACNIWYMLIFKYCTIGSALFAPHVFFSAVLTGTIAGILSKFAVNQSKAAFSATRNLCQNLIAQMSIIA